MAKGQAKKLANAKRHAFLLTFFEEPHVYSHKEINGWVLVRQFNGSSKRWQVAIFSKEAFKRMNAQSSLIN